MPNTGFIGISVKVLVDILLISCEIKDKFAHCLHVFFRIVDNGVHFASIAGREDDRLTNSLIVV